jgi:hypothetical protein
VTKYRLRCSFPSHCFETSARIPVGFRHTPIAFASHKILLLPSLKRKTNKDSWFVQFPARPGSGTWLALTLSGQRKDGQFQKPKSRRRRNEYQIYTEGRRIDDLAYARLRAGARANSTKTA